METPKPNIKIIKLNDNINNKNLESVMSTNAIVSQEIDKTKILEEYHQELGHGSKSNMNFNIRLRYKWQGMAKDISNFVDKSEIYKK